MFYGSKNGHHHRCPRCRYVRRVDELDATGRCIDTVYCATLVQRREDEKRGRAR